VDSSYVGKPCPKCAYVRSPTDVGPSWQCPKCGIAYAKFGKDNTASGVSLADRPAVRAGRSGAAGQAYTLAMLAHLSILLGLLLPLIAIVVPIVIWKVKGSEDEFAAAAAKEAINFQLSFLLWCLGLGFAALACIIAPPLVYVVMLCLAAVLIGYVILPIVAAFKTLGGDSYTYPFIRHFFE